MLEISLDGDLWTKKIFSTLLQAVQDAGLWRCFNCQEYTAKFSKGLDPADVIEKLKEAIFKYHLS